MKNWRIFGLLLFAIPYLLVSCSDQQPSTGVNPFEGMHLATLTGNKNPKTESSPTPVFGNALLLDDFSDPNSGWEIFSTSDGNAGYEDDVYLIVSNSKGLTEWGANPQTFSDLKIDTDIHAVNTSENENNGFGVDCRIQDNGDGYSFEISSDGEYAIVKFENGESTPLVDWTASSDIPIGDQTIHMTTLCQGDNLQLWVNKISIAQTTDSSFSSGRVSLSATTFDAALPARIEFDNLYITDPGMNAGGSSN